MQPNKLPCNTSSLFQAWEQFITIGLVTEGLDPVIVQSWRRCVPRLDPRSNPRPTTLKGASLAAVYRTQADLVAMATPFLEDVYQFSEGADCAIVLADGTACTLTLLGDPSGLVRLDQAGIGPGTYWAEGQLGTNALNVALLEASPVLVVGPEHYFQAYHGITTAAAPIHDVRGRIVGLVGILTAADQATPHILALVMATARAISNQLQTEWYLKEANHRLREVDTLLGSIADGVIAWNDVGEITHVNQPAAALLHLNPITVMGRPLEHVLDLPPRLLYAIQSGQELHDAEVSFTTNQDTIHCVISLRPIQDEPNGPISFLATLRPVEHIRQLVHRQVTMADTLSLTDLTTRSNQMKGALRLATAAAKGQAPILIYGETGVGKNQLARAIHNASPRAKQPFLVINCRAIPRELMLSEFLGHEGDAHTPGRLSKFELAQGGTILLDQIESLSLEMQAALLQLLETGHLMRLGGTRSMPIDVRVCATTTASLAETIQEGSLLSRLYYAFGVFTIEIPPLRERVDDIPLLAGHFLTRIAPKNSPPPALEPETLTILTRYPWPGNVRELESVLERASLNTRTNNIGLTDLPEAIRSGRSLLSPRPQPQSILTVSDAEREAIIRAGTACNGHITEMARTLGISRTTLWRKMRQYRLVPDQFKI